MGGGIALEYIISVVSPDDVKELSKILKQMNVPIFLTVFAHGTAVQSMLDLLGIDSNERRIIIAVANEGRTDTVMNAARAAGAAGGTVIHGKGTASEEAAHFFNISIASEKEMIFIVSKKEQKTQIMRSVLEKAGPGTEAGAVLFSLPVTSVEGFGLFDD